MISSRDQLKAACMTGVAFGAPHDDGVSAWSATADEVEYRKWAFGVVGDACIDSFDATELKLPAFSACYGPHRWLDGKLTARLIERAHKKFKKRVLAAAQREAEVKFAILPIVGWMFWAALWGAIQWAVQRWLTWWWEKDRTMLTWRYTVRAVQVA
jgi:hypothetical protein